MEQQQLALPTRNRRVRHDSQHTWFSGHTYDRVGWHKFHHLIRSEEDPAETAPRGGGQRGRSSNNPGGVNSRSVDQWRQEIEAIQSDQVPRTFNHIAILLTGRTADVVFESRLDKALWSLVADHRLEHSGSLPMLFRATRAGEGGHE